MPFFRSVISIKGGAAILGMFLYVRISNTPPARLASSVSILDTLPFAIVGVDKRGVGQAGDLVLGGEASLAPHLHFPIHARQRLAQEADRGPAMDRVPYPAQTARLFRLRFS